MIKYDFNLIMIQKFLFVKKFFNSEESNKEESNEIIKLSEILLYILS